MGYFSNCRPDQRFSVQRRSFGQDGISPAFALVDWDQRRTIRVVAVSREARTDENGFLDDRDDDFYFDALARHIDHLPPDVIQINVGPDSELLSTSCDPDLDSTEIANYRPHSVWPPWLPTVHRPQLTELDRLGLQTDLVTYRVGSETRMVCFKYYCTGKNHAVIWHEANCLAKIPKHPNIVPFDSLVVDSVEGGEALVVGFTNKFIPGGTVLENVSRVFKLKYLKQLIEAVDFLSLRRGIVHGDIVPWNLLIDEETDNIVLFDFNFGAKLGWEGDPSSRSAFNYEESRNDVKLTVFTMYEIITRDLHFREELYPHEIAIADVMDLEEGEEWSKHEDVRLDAPVAEYRAVLNEWLVRREKTDKEITHYTQAPEYIDWPDAPPLREIDFYGMIVRMQSVPRQTLVRKGEKFLQWQRPGSHQLPLPAGKRLLATGEVVDDEDAA
ncbi:CBL-interacting serine/threonine-protein kinase 16 [Achaetomium macrosporum]|uniref:CBL-interacting serine/threonine-protein kinase 16 n=1 Tax=Achaetomium macrosporum TaxID=79813 RepID=A0AAN7CIB8_9PEZI|nr:CBL-interacting serine/threonine-protein kinase 16 [Achaetomium macrosporum]